MKKITIIKKLHKYELGGLCDCELKKESIITLKKLLLHCQKINKR